jgi:hypothetical protein
LTGGVRHVDWLLGVESTASTIVTTSSRTTASPTASTSASTSAAAPASTTVSTSAVSSVTRVFTGGTAGEGC